MQKESETGLAVLNLLPSCQNVKSLFTSKLTYKTKYATL